MNEIPFNPETGEILEAPQQPTPRRRKKKRTNGNGRAPIPADETKRQKFIRLASQRFDRIVRSIHVMRGLGRNQSAYEYGDADVDQITDKLVAELEAMAAEMKRRGRPIQTKLDLQ